MLKNPNRAIEEYKKVVELEPYHIHSLNEMKNLYYSFDEYDKALEVSNKILEKTQDANYFIEHLNILLKLEMIDEFKNKYENLNDELKNNPDILYVLSKTDLYPKINTLEKVVNLNPKHKKANFDLAKCFFEKGEYSCAKELFEKSNELEKTSLACFYLGVIYHRENKFFEAIDNYLECIKLDKTNDVCCFELAKAYMDINWLDEAKIAIKSAIGILKLKNENLDLSEHNFLLAWILFKQNDYNSTLLYLNLIDENSKMYKDAQILKSTISLRDDDYIHAKVVFEKYYNEDEQSAQNPILIESLGKVYKHLKLYKEGIELYRKALDLHGESVFYSLELIGLLIDNYEHDEALERSKALAISAPKCPSTYNSLARIYYRLKDYDLAIENLKILNQLDLNNAEGFYFLGLVLNDINDPINALKNFNIALTLNPTPAKYYAQSARAHKKLEDYANAMLYIKEAIEIEPESIHFKKQALNICTLMGDKEKATFYNSQITRLEKLLKAR